MAEYHGKHYDPDFICQDDYEWLTDTGRYTLAGSKTCDLCQKEPALYSVDFQTATGYDGKLTCPACTDTLKEQYPYAVVVPLLTREEAMVDALHKQLSSRPAYPRRDDYEWCTDDLQCVSQRAVYICHRLNQLCDRVLSVREHTYQALLAARWFAPYSVSVLALEAVMEALEEQLAHLCTRIALVSTYPRVGYYRLPERSEVQA